jgi:hypothetical protein
MVNRCKPPSSSSQKPVLYDHPVPYRGGIYPIRSWAPAP